MTIINEYTVTRTHIQTRKYRMNEKECPSLHWWINILYLCIKVIIGCILRNSSTFTKPDKKTDNHKKITLEYWQTHTNKRTQTHTNTNITYTLYVRISGSHPGDLGSFPRMGTFAL